MSDQDQEELDDIMIKLVSCEGTVLRIFELLWSHSVFRPLEGG